MKSKQYKAYRIGLLFVLLATYIKFFFFLPMFRENLQVKLQVSDLFPGVLSSTPFLFVCYFLPLLTLICFFVKTKWVYVSSALLVVLCSLFFVLHLDTYNDATFKTTLWAGIWLFLLAWSPLEKGNETLQLIGLGQLIIAMIFLGGFVGKLTSEYWSGEALYAIYFLYKETFPYPILRELLELETVREIAKYFSIGVIVTEGAMALSFLLPVKPFVIVGVLVCTGIVLFSHPYLFSVMGPLIGMILSIHFLNKEDDGNLSAA